MQQLIRTAGSLEAEWREVLWRSVSTGAKEDESSSRCILDVGFHLVTARSRLAHVLKLMNRLFI
jgi:hypothetical protein